MHSLGQSPCIPRQAGDAVAGFRDDLFALAPLGLSHDQAAQIEPGTAGVRVPGV